jgi:hypothetical protein
MADRRLQRLHEYRCNLERCAVNQLNFHYGDPRFPAPDINWNIGLDNPRIVETFFAPPAVPDGSDGPPLVVQKAIASGNRLRLLFDTSSCAGNIDHQVLFGFGTELPGTPGGIYQPGGSKCAVGGSPYTWNNVPDPATDPTGLLWFLIVANDGSTIEGSWSPDGAGNERQGPGVGGASAECGIVEKDVSNRCGL